MAQYGNTYTGRLADIPTYLTKNHLYYAYDTKQLYAFNEDDSPYLLAPIPEEDPIFTESPAFGITSLDIDGWDLAVSWGDHAEANYLKSVAVVGLNTNPIKHDIAEVDGKIISETVTKLNQPFLDGNNLVLKYENENGIEQTVSIDLSGLVTADLHISNSNWDAATKKLTLTRNDGVPFVIDLNQFSLITNTDAYGITTVAQEGTVKLTISKVGQSGLYEDLLGKPTIPDAYTHPTKVWVNKSNLSGANVISNLTIDSLGHPTGWTTRVLTPQNIGAEPAFGKYTGFNRNFGFGYYDVLRGEDYSGFYIGNITDGLVFPTVTEYTRPLGYYRYTGSADVNVTLNRNNGYYNFEVYNIGSGTITINGTSGTDFETIITIAEGNLPTIKPKGTAYFKFVSYVYANGIEKYFWSITGDLVGDGTEVGGSDYTHPSKTWVNKSNLSGATVISNLTIDTLGHPTGWSTRNITLSDIGADKYDHWKLGANHSYNNVSSGAQVNFLGAGGTTVSRVGNTITIESSTTSGGTSDGNNYLSSVLGSTNGTLTFKRTGLSDINLTTTHTHPDDTVDVTSNITLNASHNQKTLLCNGSVVITIPAGLGSSFSCNFINTNTSTGVVTIVAGSGVTLKAPHGAKLLADYTCNIIKRTGSETYHLQGELTV